MTRHYRGLDCASAAPEDIMRHLLTEISTGASAALAAQRDCQKFFQDSVRFQRRSRHAKLATGAGAAVAAGLTILCLMQPASMALLAVSAASWLAPVVTGAIAYRAANALARSRGAAYGLEIALSFQKGHRPLRHSANAVKEAQTRLPALHSHFTEGRRLASVLLSSAAVMGGLVVFNDLAGGPLEDDGKRGLGGVALVFAAGGAVMLALGRRVHLEYVEESAALVSQAGAGQAYRPKAPAFPPGSANLTPPSLG